VSARSLSADIRRGALWSIATTGLLKIANVLTTAVIAHILNPKDFGVYAVALTAFGIVSAIGEFGMGACLLRADLDIDSLAPTMATIAVTTNAIQAAVMVAFAEPIASALGSAVAAGPIRVLALAMLITGVFAVPAAQLVRDFKQDKIFLANIIGFVPSTTALILLAISGSGAMALAWSMVIGSTVSGFVMIASVPRHYLLGFSKSALHILVKFGFPLGCANIVNYILLNGDYAVVGHIAGAVALGAYVLAFNVASWPTSLLGFMVNNVSMPAFSQVKGDVDRLKDAIARAVRAIALVVMPMSALTIALARPLILTLYGSKWIVSVRPLSMLALYGAISIICVLFANILASVGRAKFILMVQLVWLAALIPGMLLGVWRDGIFGAAVAHVFIIAAIVLPIYLFGMRKLTSVAALVNAVLPAILGALVAALAARSLASQFTEPLVQLMAGLVAGGLVYLIVAGPSAIILLSPKQAKMLRGRLMGERNWVGWWSRLTSAWAIRATSRRETEPVSPQETSPQPRRRIRRPAWRPLAAREPGQPPAGTAPDPPAEPTSRPTSFGFRRPPVDPAIQMVRGGLARPPVDSAERLVPTDFRRPPVDPAMRSAPGNWCTPTRKEDSVFQ
jgi:lipopolysaccharide exporter